MYENVEVVRRAYALGPAGHLDDPLELYDAQAEWVPEPQSALAGSPYRGREGVRRFWRELLSSWEEYLVEPVEFTELGDQVAVINRVRGRSRSGIEVDETWSSLFDLSDGRIVRVQGFADRGAALRAARSQP